MRLGILKKKKDRKEGGKRNRLGEEEGNSEEKRGREKNKEVEETVCTNWVPQFLPHIVRTETLSSSDLL